MRTIAEQTCIEPWIVLLCLASSCATDPVAFPTLDIQSSVDATSNDSEDLGESVCDRIDNNDNGLIDEGCAEAPALQADQSWLDLGWVNLKGAGPQNTRSLITSEGQ
ncbi:MAG TPA: hypothetical protein DCQ06_14560, partial [Myxococcales bacterium]|nr:hypothetical protein [Myxococcales bacterium]